MIVVFALIGATLLVVRSTIFGRVRNIWPALFECAQCTGVWIGALAGATGIVSVGHGRVLDAVIVGCATSFLSLLADGVLLSLLGAPGEE